MASTLKVQNIAHTDGTTGISIDTTGIVTHPLKSHFRVFRHGQGSVQSYGRSVGLAASGHMTFTEESIVSSDQTSGINYIGNHYKAPVAGNYFFYFNGFSSALAGSSAGSAGNGSMSPDNQTNHFLIVRASSQSAILAPANTGTSSSVVASAYSKILNNSGDTVTHANMNMSGSCVLAKDEVVGVVIHEGYVYVPASGPGGDYGAMCPVFGGFLIG